MLSSIEDTCIIRLRLKKHCGRGSRKNGKGVQTWHNGQSHKTKLKVMKLGKRPGGTGGDGADRDGREMRDVGNGREHCGQAGCMPPSPALKRQMYVVSSRTASASHLLGLLACATMLDRRL